MFWAGGPGSKAHGGNSTLALVRTEGGRPWPGRSGVKRMTIVGCKLGMCAHDRAGEKRQRPGRREKAALMAAGEVQEAREAAGGREGGGLCLRFPCRESGARMEAAGGMR